MKKFTCPFSHNLPGKENMIGMNARVVFFAGEQPSSAPQEAPKSKETMDEIPSLDHMKKEVERFENNIKGFLGDMEKFYNEGLSDDMKVTISTTEFNDELEAKYKAAGMGEKAIGAIHSLVDGLNSMKAAIAEKEDSNTLVLTRISAAVSFINDTMKNLSNADLYGASIRDPLKATMTPSRMDELKMREEEKAPEPAPEAKEASTDEMVQSSITAVVKNQDHLVHASALLDKCAGKQLEITKDSPLYIKEMANDGLIRAVVTPSTDGKSVRVEWWITGAAGGHQDVKEIRQEHIYHLDDEDKGTEEFGSQTEAAEQDENLQKNREKFRKDIAWLKGEAPVGSRVTMSDNLSVLKDADGELYVVRMKDGKEESRAPYEEEGMEDVDAEPMKLTKGVEMTEITPEQREEAMKHYKAAVEAYNEGHLDTSMEQFEKAYAVAANPNIRLGIVQILMDKGLYKQAYVEAQATAKEFEDLIPKIPSYKEAYGNLKGKLATIETRLATGSVMLVSNKEGIVERQEASEEVSKRVARKKIYKIARDLILLASSPRTEKGEQLIRDLAQQIGEIAQTNGIESVTMKGTGATGQKHFVRIESGKVAWGPVKKSDAEESDLRYAQGELTIEHKAA